MIGQELISRTSAIALVAEYQSAVREVEQAFALLQKAKQRMTLVFGGYHGFILAGNVNDYNLEDELVRSKELMRKKAWSGVFAKINIREILSVTKAEELDRQLRGELPELTEENLWASLKQLDDNMGSLLEDSAREVFDFLRPHQERYETNSTTQVGEKVIIESAMDKPWKKEKVTSLDSYHEKYIRALDNVFHLLDGQGISKYPDDLCTVIKDALRGRMQSCDTPYFSCKWFRNTNLHITFKRLDLVQELNKLAGSDKIKQA
jgi:hypothetical protein